MSFIRNRMLIRLVMFTVFTVALSIVYAVTIPSARAARGGLNCDIADYGGIKGGNTNLPASIKVKFLDGNGNPVTKKIEYTVKSYSNDAATTDGLNISNAIYDSASGLNNLQRGKNSNRSATCASTVGNPVSNFDIYSWRKPLGGGVYDGNGWVLFCRDHTPFGGDPQQATDQIAYYRIKDITPLLADGDTPKGKWMLAGSSWQPSDAKFSVTNGATKVLTFQWQPYTVKVFKYNSPPEHPADPTPRDNNNNTSDVPYEIYNATVQIRPSGVVCPVYGQSKLNPGLISNVPDQSLRAVFETVPGYKVSKVEINGVDRSRNLSDAGGLDCTSGPDAIGGSAAPFDYDPAQANNVNVIMVWYTKDTQSISVCPKAASSGSYPFSYSQSDFEFDGVDLYNNTDTRNFIYGYAFNAFDPTYQPIVEVVIGSDQYISNVAPGSERFKFKKIDNIKGYAWTFELPSQYQNGNTYNASIYWKRSAGSGRTGPVATITWPGGTACDINIDAAAYPWLQTARGDVIASSGNIIGNYLSGNKAGQRKSTDSEAEFLVMSYLGSNANPFANPFCSTYKYILTNTTSLSNCNNGLGYALNAYPLGDASNDNVVKAVNNAYDNFGSCKSGIQQTFFNLLPLNSSLPTDCNGGKIYKRAGDLTIGLNSTGGVSPTSAVKQRATILVEGDLTINNDIVYDNTPVVKGVLPSLAIVVAGNIYIKPNVSTIQAALYSTGTINTCYVSVANSNTCFTKLKVDGLLAARQGFYFQRTFWDNLSNPAELVFFSPNLLLNPPPGVNLYNFNSNLNSGYISDPSEYQPRY